MQDFVVLTIEERLQRWRESEKAACDAEGTVARLGQAAADPATRDLFIQAGKLRTQADREFAAILRAVRLEESGH